MSTPVMFMSPALKKLREHTAFISALDKVLSTGYFGLFLPTHFSLNWVSGFFLWVPVMLMDARVTDNWVFTP